MILDTRQSGCVVRRRGRRLKDGPGIATMATVSVCTSWPAVMRRCAGRQAKVAGAAKVVKRTVEATTDEITSELQEALKS
jgi:hypothetical protein